MKRSVAIDWMKAVCILYIVGFWHLFNYTHAFPSSENRLTHEITIMVLGLFTLVSGYLIGNKNLNFTKSDIFKYTTKRLLRIYPPYIGALFLFAILKISSLNSLALSIFPVSLYANEAPLTLWYIVMLLSFYIMTPFLLPLRNKLPYFLIVCIGIEITLLAMSVLYQTFDPRIAIYFPCFATGLLLSGHQKNFNTLTQPSYYSALIGLSIGITIQALFFSTTEQAMSDFDIALNLPIAAMIPLTVFISIMRIEDKIPKLKIIEVISYASFFLYLFHRPVYKPMTYFLMPDSNMGQILFLVFLCFPMAIAFSWTGQKIYDVLLPRIFPPKKCIAT